MPNRAHLVLVPATAHVAGRGDAVAEGEWLVEGTAAWVCAWRQYLARADGEATGGQLRCDESTRRPLGDPRSVEKISALLGRDLLPRKPRREPKERK